MAEERAHLIIMPPQAAPRVVPLRADELTLGSALSCDVPIADTEVEPLHARVRRGQTGWEIVREGHGLIVNGKRVRHQLLASGDLLLLGRTAVSFRLGRAPSSLDGLSAPLMQELATRLAALARRLDANEPASVLRRQAMLDLEALAQADFAAFAWVDAAGRLETLETTPNVTEKRALSRSVIARVMDQKRAVLFLGNDESELDNASSLRAAAVSAVMAAPVMQGDGVRGVLSVASASTGAFTHAMLDWVVLYATLIGQLLVANDTKRLLEARVAETPPSSPLLGASAAVRALIKDIGKIARSELSVLIIGETGTGKELVAREVHAKSARAAGPFIAVNCGAIPESLVESTLFGHVKGAFTGAHADAKGLIASAEGGTLFLDEVAELSSTQQTRLLRVVEARELVAVGATHPVRVNVRLVSATHAAIDDPKRRGAFREDLFYRLAGVILRTAPLRERGGDALFLAELFLRGEAVALNRPALRLSAAARSALETARWPGNVRELKTAITRACALAEGDVIEPGTLGIEPGTAASIKPLAQVKDAAVKEYVLRVVEQFGGNRTAAAEALGVTARTIFKYLEEV